MLQIALETSSKNASLSVHQESETLAERRLDPAFPTTTTLVTQIESALSQARISTSQIDLISLTIGPGSFTGLRVGVTVAKTLAYGLNCSVIGVGTLEVIAAQCWENSQAAADLRIVCVMDAQRGEWFSSSFESSSDGGLVELAPTRIVQPAELLAAISGAAIFTGPALSKTPIQGFQVADRSVWHPRSTTVARLARARFEQGHRDDVFALRPRYYRPSAAEEKLRQKSED